MEENTKKAGKNFMVQGAILGVASILVRIIGLIYRVPLNNILGEQGVAYYGVAFDVYSILLLISSYSMPLAVSKMVSANVATGKFKNTKKILICSIFFSLLCGLAAFCITYFGADIFAKVWNYPNSALALKVLSPALVILSVLGVMRGFFQGLGRMTPTAVSNIIEQIINAIVSVTAATFLVKTAKAGENAAARGAAGGTLGTVSGAMAALIFVVVLFLLSYKKVYKQYLSDDTDSVTSKVGPILRVIVATIVPVIVSTTIYNIGSLLDTGVFSNLMAVKGYDQATIETLTGMYTGNYRLIVNVPIALASALASSLIPSVVASVAKGSRGQVIRKIESAIRLTMIISLPCSVGIGVLAKPIIHILFPSSVDPDKVALMLMIGCICVALYSLSTITNSILQGIDKMRIPVRHSAISLVAHLAILALTLWITDFNIFCVVAADMLFALFMCILNHHALRKYLDFRQEIKKTFIIPLVSSLIMGAFAFAAYKLVYSLVHSNLISFIAAVIIAVIEYALSLLILRAVDEEELLMMPGGTKIVRILKKVKLIR